MPQRRHLLGRPALIGIMPGVVTVVVLGSAALAADPPPVKPVARATKQTGQSAASKALAEFRRGQALYRQKKYVEAAARFQAAAHHLETARQPLNVAWM